jgi:hypothetical protein
MPVSEAKAPPILRHKRYEAASAFTPENLLRQARRQKRLPNIAVPEICILDPDGDIVRNLRATERASRLGLLSQRAERFSSRRPRIRYSGLRGRSRICRSDRRGAFRVWLPSSAQHYVRRAKSPRCRLRLISS